VYDTTGSPIDIDLNNVYASCRNNGNWDKTKAFDKDLSSNFRSPDFPNQFIAIVLKAPISKVQISFVATAWIWRSIWAQMIYSNTNGDISTTTVYQIPTTPNMTFIFGADSTGRSVLTDVSAGSSLNSILVLYGVTPNVSNFYYLPIPNYYRYNGVTYKADSTGIRPVDFEAFKDGGFGNVEWSAYLDKAMLQAQNSNLFGPEIITTSTAKPYFMIALGGQNDENATVPLQVGEVTIYNANNQKINLTNDVVFASTSYALKGNAIDGNIGNTYYSSVISNQYVLGAPKATTAQPHYWAAVLNTTDTIGKIQIYTQQDGWSFRWVRGRVILSTATLKISVKLIYDVTMKPFTFFYNDTTLTDVTTDDTFPGALIRPYTVPNSSYSNFVFLTSGTVYRDDQGLLYKCENRLLKPYPIEYFLRNGERAFSDVWIEFKSQFTPFITTDPNQKMELSANDVPIFIVYKVRFIAHTDE
jgi:hypothetical protein